MLAWFNCAKNRMVFYQANQLKNTTRQVIVKHTILRGDDSFAGGNSDPKSLAQMWEDYTGEASEHAQPRLREKHSNPTPHPHLLLPLGNPHAFLCVCCGEGMSPFPRRKCSFVHFLYNLFQVSLCPGYCLKTILFKAADGLPFANFTYLSSYWLPCGT